MSLYAISFADVLEGFTESFIIWKSYVAFTYGLIVFLVVIVVSLEHSYACFLDFHSVYGPCWIFTG